MLDWRTMVIGVVCLASCSDDGGPPTESEAPDDAIEEPGPAVGPGDDSTPDQPGEPDGEPGDDTGSEPEPGDTGEPTDGEPGDDTGSDLEAETSPHGAVSLEVLPGCAIEAGAFNFPDGETPPVSATERLESWSDGEAVDGKEISVDCAWAAGRITITIGDRDSDQPRNVGMSFTAAPGEVGSGTLRLQAPELPQQYGTEQGGQQCEFSLFELDAEAGSVWGRFSCPAIVPIESPGSDSCEVSAGYFYMRNCEVL